MKIRNGFVSNSSSSSFIIQLTKDANSYSLQEFMEEYEVSEQNKELAEALLQDLKDYEVEDSTYIYLDLDDCDIPSDTYDEVYKDVINFAEKRIRQAKEELKNKFVYTLEYSDESGDFCSKMEHEFVPNFKGTREVFSHH